MSDYEEFREGSEVWRGWHVVEMEGLLQRSDALSSADLISKSVLLFTVQLLRREDEVSKAVMGKVRQTHLQDIKLESD